MRTSPRNPNSFKILHKLNVRHRLRIAYDQVHVVGHAPNFEKPSALIAHNPTEVFEEPGFHVCGEKRLAILRAENKMGVFDVERLAMSSKLAGIPSGRELS